MILSCIWDEPQEKNTTVSERYPIFLESHVSKKPFRVCIKDVPWNAGWAFPAKATDRTEKKIDPALVPTKVSFFFKIHNSFDIFVA